MSKKLKIEPVKLDPISDEEDAAINAAIASDPDTFELTEEWFKGARFYRDDHPEVMYGITPKAAPEMIEQLRETEPETARSLEAHNRKVDEAKRKNWPEFAAAYPERARELEAYDRQFEKSERARKSAARAPQAKAG
ncbi:MAG: hypothetical protein ACYYKD_03915 [Rhodospirillales bacterium]